MRPTTNYQNLLILAIGLVLVCATWFFMPPSNFPIETTINVPQGEGLFSLGENLHKEHVIRSTLLFRIVTTLLGGERDMKAGEYYLAKPQNLLTVVWRIAHGKYEVDTVKITVPEGFTVEKISKLFDKRFKTFSHQTFERVAPEGYLFPDTYFVPVTATASSTINLMRENFIRRIFPIMPEVEASKKSLEDIITMASLIEAEAKTEQDRLMVSDILWKRLKIGMPLQVDSEMGTYEFAGLPDKPINNPGLLSIEASLHPTTTPYLYFLTGKDGNMHYAKTFDEHVRNKEKYLR
ncbi:endolytic transglycosylase MltG [Candidatus Parcubacteria bacterium]|nr:endolytic transglycosylase MltG [Candidatus Parcubacteria bacterium]